MTTFVLKKRSTTDNQQTTTESQTDDQIKLISEDTMEVSLATPKHIPFSGFSSGGVRKSSTSRPYFSLEEPMLESLPTPDQSAIKKFDEQVSQLVMDVMARHESEIRKQLQLPEDVKDLTVNEVYRTTHNGTYMSVYPSERGTRCFRWKAVTGEEKEFDPTKGISVKIVDLINKSHNCSFRGVATYGNVRYQYRPETKDIRAILYMAVKSLLVQDRPVPTLVPPTPIYSKKRKVEELGISNGPSEHLQMFAKLQKENL